MTTRARSKKPTHIEASWPAAPAVPADEPGGVVLPFGPLSVDLSRTAATPAVAGTPFGYRRNAETAVLPFGPVRIEPGQTIEIPARPEMPFRGKRLAYAGPSGTFVLKEIFVGRNGQWLRADARVPLELFPPVPPLCGRTDEWLNNCGVHDRTEIGMSIRLLVENVSRTSAEFDALMFGEID